MPFKKLLLTLGFLSLLLVFGCSNNAEDRQVNYDLIASEKTVPADFDKMAFKRDTSPYFQYLVKKIDNQLEFEETWNLYRFEKKVPRIDFSEKNIMFIGLKESGSCPYKIKKLELSSNKKAITLTLSKLDGACTADATPRTFVLEVNRKVFRDLKNVVIVVSGSESTIPIDGN
jgi:hypothetical protein